MGYFDKPDKLLKLENTVISYYEKTPEYFYIFCAISGVSIRIHMRDAEEISRLLAESKDFFDSQRGKEKENE